MLHPSNLMHTAENSGWKEYTPTHIKEAYYSLWKSWFAWRPVKTEQGEWVWLRHVWFRTAFLPLWFYASDYFTQYSLIQKSYWEE